MKKAAVISAMLLALAMPFGGALAEESAAGEAASVSSEIYTYDNRASGLTMKLPENRVENEKSSPRCIRHSFRMREFLFPFCPGPTASPTAKAG